MRSANSLSLYVLTEKAPFVFAPSDAKQFTGVGSTLVAEPVLGKVGLQEMEEVMCNTVQENMQGVGFMSSVLRGLSESLCQGELWFIT